ncbi:hypothetical protein CQA89_33105, partial [Klebsiella pneumoniae]
TISESEHRIHNPFTPEKYATLGRRCEWRRAPPLSISLAFLPSVKASTVSITLLPRKSTPRWDGAANGAGHHH